MKKRKVLQAVGRIVAGRFPSLSIEITRDCPLKCPGCYAYEPAHLGELGPLSSLADYRGTDLVERILKLVDYHKPLHLSLVGGEPLLRWREINDLLLKLSGRDIEVQVVTSGVVPIPRNWINLPELQLVLSVDGLREDHDERRKPATYEKILKNIEGSQVKIHCTITRQMLGKAGYFEEFLRFWSARTEVRKIWFSIFTPQRNSTDPEALSAEDRNAVLDELGNLRTKFPKLYLPDLVLDGFRHPPQSPEECIFAKTTISMTADLQTRITPCQFGGDPDCSRCGCMASVGLKAVGDYKMLGMVPVSAIFRASDALGRVSLAVKSKSAFKPVTDI